MALGLKFDAGRRISNALPAVVAAIETGIRSAPYLMNQSVGMNFYAIKIERYEWLLDSLFVFELV